MGQGSRRVCVFFDEFYQKHWIFSFKCEKMYQMIMVNNLLEMFERRFHMIYSKEVEEMCPVAQGVNHGCAPIPEEAKWVCSDLVLLVMPKG